MSYQEFRENLKSYVKLDEKYCKYNKYLNNIRSKKLDIKPKLINYMNIKNINNIPLNSNFNLKLKETNQYAFISKNHIKNILNKYIDSNDDIDIIIKDIYESRNKKMIYDINITKKE